MVREYDASKAFRMKSRDMVEKLVKMISMSNDIVSWRYCNFARLVVTHGGTSAIADVSLTVVTVFAWCEEAARGVEWGERMK